MKILTDNGFEFYKEKETWDVREAVCVVNGYEQPREIYIRGCKEIIEPIFQESLKAFNAGKLKSAKDIKIDPLNRFEKEFYQEFYNSDDNYNCGYLKCFNSIEYVKWLKEQKLIKLPEQLRVSKNMDGAYNWDNKTGYEPQDDICRDNPVAVFEKFRQDQQTISNYYKNLSFWSLKEAAALLHYNDPQCTLSKAAELTLNVLHRASLTNEFQLKCIVENENFFSPFEILVWANKAEIEIPNALKYYVKDDDPNQKYFWVKEDSLDPMINGYNNSDYVTKNRHRLDELLLKSRKEIDILYESLKRVLKLKKKPLFDTNSEDVLEAFSRIENKFNYLIAADINKGINEPSNPTRDIKGKIILSIVERLLPEAMIDKSIKTDYQSLFLRSNDLMKNLTKK